MALSQLFSSCFLVLWLEGVRAIKMPLPLLLHRLHRENWEMELAGFGSSRMLFFFIWCYLKIKLDRSLTNINCTEKLKNSNSRPGSSEAQVLRPSRVGWPHWKLKNSNPRPGSSEAQVLPGPHGFALASSPSVSHWSVFFFFSSSFWFQMIRSGWYHHSERVPCPLARVIYLLVSVWQYKFI